MLLVVVGVGAAGVAGIAASLVCFKESSSYCGVAQLGWTLLMAAALLAVPVGVAWLWRRRPLRTRAIASVLTGLLGLAGVIVVIDGSGRGQPTIVGVVEAIDEDQVCWRPVELAPLTDTPRPIPARLEGAPRCAAPGVVRGDELGPDETVYVELLRARHTQQWRVTSAHVRNTIVALVEAADADQVCWTPVALAPLTDTPRPIPARLEAAPRCATRDVVGAEGLTQGQTVHVACCVTPEPTSGGPPPYEYATRDSPGQHRGGRGRTVREPPSASHPRLGIAVTTAPPTEPVRRGWPLTSPRINRSGFLRDPLRSRAAHARLTVLRMASEVPLMASSGG